MIQDAPPNCLNVLNGQNAIKFHMTHTFRRNIECKRLRYASYRNKL